MWKNQAIGKPFKNSPAYDSAVSHLWQSQLWKSHSAKTCNTIYCACFKKVLDFISLEGQAHQGSHENKCALFLRERHNSSDGSLWSNRHLLPIPWSQANTQTAVLYVQCCCLSSRWATWSVSGLLGVRRGDQRIGSVISKVLVWLLKWGK